MKRKQIAVSKCLIHSDLTATMVTAIIDSLRIVSFADDRSVDENVKIRGIPYCNSHTDSNISAGMCSVRSWFILLSYILWYEDEDHSSGSYTSGSTFISEASEYSEESRARRFDYSDVQPPLPGDRQKNSFNASSTATINQDTTMLSLDSTAPSPSYTSSSAFVLDADPVADTSHISQHPNSSTAVPPASGKRMRTEYNPQPQPVKVGIRNIAWSKDVTSEVRATISEVMGSVADGVTMLPSFYAMHGVQREIVPFAYFIAPSIGWARWFCAMWNQMVTSTIWRDSSAFYEIMQGVEDMDG